MIDVVSSANRHLYADEVEQMWRLRHQIYVHERGWHDLAKADGREIDQFDTDKAIYLLAIEGRSTVVGGTRLVSTAEPNIVSEVFHRLASVRGVPRSPRIYDWTRYFVVPHRRESHAISPVASALMCAVQEFCLAEGIEQVQIMLETFWIPRFIEIGWNPQPLGLPEMVAGEPVAAVLCDVGEEVLQRTRQIRGVTGPALRARGSWRRPGDELPVLRAG